MTRVPILLIFLVVKRQGHGQIMVYMGMPRFSLLLLTLFTSLRKKKLACDLSVPGAGSRYTDCCADSDM